MLGLINIVSFLKRHASANRGGRADAETWHALGGHACARQRRMCTHIAQKARAEPTVVAG